MSSWRHAQPWDQQIVEQFCRHLEPESIGVWDRIHHEGKALKAPWWQSLFIYNDEQKKILGLLFAHAHGLCIPVFQRREIALKATLSPGLPQLQAFALVGLERDVCPLIHHFGVPRVQWQYHTMMLSPSKPEAIAPPRFSPTLYSRFLGLDCRLAIIDDLDALLELEEAYQIEEVLIPGTAFNREGARYLLHEQIQNGRLLSVFHNDLALAKAGISAHGHCFAQVGGVYTRKEWRGHGLATQLMNLLVQAMLASGWGLSLFVRQENQSAITVYQRVGFQHRSPYRIVYYQEPA